MRLSLARSRAGALLFAFLLSVLPGRGAVAQGSVDIQLSDGVFRKLPLSEVLPGGPAVVHFWATWCAPCRTELARLDDFIAGVTTETRSRILVVSVDSIPYQRIRAFLHEDLGLSHLESWQVVGGNPGSSFGIRGYPSTLLLGAAGEVAGLFSGPLDWRKPEVRNLVMGHLGVMRPHAGFEPDGPK